MKNKKNLICLLGGLVLWLGGFWLVRRSGISWETLRVLPYLMIGIGCGLFGYGVGEMVNRRVLAAAYSFQDQSARSWTALSLTGILEVWGDFLALFGYPADRWQQAATGAVPLFSLPGLLGAAGILLGVLGIVGVGLNYPVYKKLLRSGKEKYAFEIMQLAREISEAGE